MFRRLIDSIRNHPIAVIAAALFVFLAGRIAFTRTFLPYDEGYHYGLIQFYAHHPNPFMSHEPAGMSALGLVAHQGSYLYHYLLSLPLHGIQLFWHTSYSQLLALRSFDLMFGLVTLYLVYRVARRLGLGRIPAQLVVLALAITPVFYDLAAQLNYDNLLLPLTLLCVIMALNWRSKVREGQAWSLQLAGLLALLLLTSLVKYSFLPIMAVVVVYVLAVLLKTYGWRAVPATLYRGFRAVSRAQKAVIITLLLVSSGLWAQRYGVNLVQYHTPNPQCNAVLSVQTCFAYTPWERNYQLHATRAERSNSSVLHFTRLWAQIMFTETYSIVKTTAAGSVQFDRNQPLVVTGMMLIGAGLVAGLFSLRRLLKRVPDWPLLAGIAGAYLLVLWGQNYSDYRNLHFIIAVQGRYLLPVLPIVFAGLALAYVHAFDAVLSFQHTRLRAALGGLVVVCWLGLQSLRRIGHLVLESVTRTGTRVQVLAHDIIIRTTPTT